MFVYAQFGAYTWCVWQVRKYFMVHITRFLKGYHSRTYFYSSGTIHARAGSKLKRYILSLYDSSDDEDAPEGGHTEDAGDGGEADGGEEAGEGEEDSGGKEDESQTQKPKEKIFQDPASMLRKVVYKRNCTYTHNVAHMRDSFVKRVYTRSCTYTYMCVYVRFCTSMFNMYYVYI